MNTLRKTLLPILVIALSHPFCWSQASMNKSVNSERPSAQAKNLNEVPIIDGEVLNDEIWQTLPSFGSLKQVQPHMGQEASESTEIRVGFSATTFYIGVICHDKTPDKLVVSDSRRDASLDEDDSFIFILDTYNDGQNGFLFGTNSLGMQYDAQVDNEGQGNNNVNRQQGGTIGGFNLNWDATWEVKTKVGEFGWSAEFAIPFRTLRFRAGENQTWGVNFRRNIQKTNEVTYWAPLPNGFDIKRLSLAGKLHGLNLKNPGNLKVIPYVLGQVARDYELMPSETNTDFEIGGDIKYSITPSLTLDLTYNTDFAQVEVDEQQVNLDRFNLFFPEKRPFFLENAGLFSVGSPGEVDLFFSRRIGIGDGGELVPIIGGARLSGKVKQTNIGFLNMVTDNVDEANIEKNNFTVARVNHEFKNRSSIGGAFTNREGLGNQEDDYNRTFTVDGKLGLGKKAQLVGFYSKSITPNIEEKDHAFKFRAEYDWDRWNLRAAFTEVGEGFNPEIGFLERSAFRKPELLIFYRHRANGKFGLLELRPHTSYRGYWNFEGTRTTSFWHIDNHWEWESGFEVHTGINITSEGVLDTFEISDGVFVPTGTYNHKEAQIILMTNQSKPVSISTRSVIGGFFGGDRISNRVTLKVRLGDKFNSEFILNHNDIKLPDGDFTATVFASRLSYSFNPRMYVQSLTQYNNVVDKWSINVRFGWLRKANTGLFVVYNETRGGELGGINNRSFIVKYSYQFDLLK